MSVGEESAGETEMRTIKAHSGSKSFFGQDEMSALTLFFGSDDEDKGGETVSSAFTGRVQIWCDIVREIGRRYRYALSLYNTKTSAKQDGKESRALFMPLLRRICQRSGIRLVARNYEVGKNCVCFGGRGLTATYPIAPTDVLDVLPLVKHAASGELLMLPVSLPYLGHNHFSSIFYSVWRVICTVLFQQLYWIIIACPSS
jgi:protein TIF31